jgi:hypothetical protein
MHHFALACKSKEFDDLLVQGGIFVAVIAKVEPELVSVQGAEVMTGRSRWSWRRDAYAGKIASVKLGKKLLIPIAEIRRVVAEGTRPRLEQPTVALGQSFQTYGKAHR